MKAWINQRAHQVRKMGDKLAPWYCFWREPDGKLRSRSCGIGAIGKRAARELAERLHVELATGTYETGGFRRKCLAGLCEEWVQRCQGRNLRPTTIDMTIRIQAVFRSFWGGDFPIRNLGAAEIDRYVTIRLAGSRPGWKQVVPETINKELRVMKAMLRMAADRGHIVRAPRVEMLRVDEKSPTFISSEQFVQLLSGLPVATMPIVPNVSPEVWWRGLLMFAFFTGWRINQILSVRRDDLDLASGRVLTRAAHNKGRRDLSIALHPVVIEALRPLMATFDDAVFPWPRNLRSLWREFHRIQEAAGLPLGGKNGFRFGFHDLRRGFATANAANLTAFQVQHLMQHRSITTTQKYVAMGTPVLDAVHLLQVPHGLGASPVLG